MMETPVFKTMQGWHQRKNFNVSFHQLLCLKIKVKQAQAD